MREIRLYGHLRKQFGKLHRFDVASPAEAIRALCANFREFRREFSEGYYAILDGNRDLPMDHLALGGEGVIRIVPVQAGAFDKPWLNILAGAVIIAAVVATGGAAGFFGATWTPILAGMGTSMILGGVSSLLAKPPKLDTKNDSNTGSMGFDGPVNTYTQGQPVPIGYGRLMIGSNVISASITAAASTGFSPIQPCGGGFIAGTGIRTTAGHANVEGFVTGDDVSCYDPETSPRVATPTTVEWAGATSQKNRVVEIGFEYAGSVFCAWDTDLYSIEEGITIPAGDVTAGMRLAKVGTGSLLVTSKVDSTEAITYQVCGNVDAGTHWFAEHSTGLLFANYRTQNNDDSQF